MKRLLSILFLFFSITTNAQITRVDSVYTPRKLKIPKFQNRNLYSYSIGIKAYSLEEFPKILNQINSQDFRNTSFSGLIIKYNDNQISYRLSANYYSKDISFQNECKDCQEARGNLEDISLRVGFEKNFIYADVQPYFSGDIGFRRNSFKGNVRALSSNNFTAYDVATLKNGLSFSPGFGIKFNLVNHFTLAAETGMDLLYSYEKQERTYNDADRTGTFNQYKKWEFLLKPVSQISLQYNFGMSY